MSNTLLTCLKAMILLAPLPFGAVGKIFSPLFYLLMAIFSLAAMAEISQPARFPYRKQVRFLGTAFLAFLVLQIVPLPVFLLKWLSPATVEILNRLGDSLPAFHPISTVPLETLTFACRFLVIAFFFRVMIDVKFDKSDMVDLIKTLVLSGALQAGFGFIKYVSGNRYFFLFFQKADPDDPLVRYLTGTLGNPDHFAFYLEMIIPSVLALLFFFMQYFQESGGLPTKFVSLVREDPKILYYFTAPMVMGAAVVLTGSRAGVLTMVFSFMIFFLFTFYLKRSRAIRRKLKFFFLGITALALFVGIQNTVDKFMSTNFESYGRFLRWPATVSMVRDFPVLGSGYGTYRYAFYLYDRDPKGGWSTHAHNDYLEVFAEGGIIGGLLLTALLGLIVFSIYRMWSERRHPDVKILGIGILVGLFAVIFHSLFDFSLRIPANLFTFTLLLILGIKLGTYKREFE